MKRVALVTGLSGQDGSYLTEFLLDRDYEVHGLVPYGRREFCDRRAELHYGDLTDGSHLTSLLDRIAPDEVYNLAAQSHVRVSFDLPVYTADVTGLGALRVLEAIRQYRESTGREPRFYQASSSEMFGNAPSPQDETTPFGPRSPYACAKVFAYWQTVNYREAYNLFAVNGILFNHESPRRGETFVTRKISLAVARIKAGRQDKLYLGNLDAQRDWGYAAEYVEAMWRMLQADEPDDFVIATGETHSVGDFARAAFEHVDLDWEKYVETDTQFHRPAEVDLLLGDPSKAKDKLGWEPQLKFAGLVGLMVDADLKLVEQGG
ncbi:MAG: GDP-mannose 4,6-dehydratase [Planctomycetaceae bacterium]